MKTAYLIPAFPKPSETFIVREIRALTRLGMDIQVYSFISPKGMEYEVEDIPIRYISYMDAAREMPSAVLKAGRLSRANDEIQRNSTLKSKERKSFG